MAVEERSRRALYDLLKEPLGMAATDALLDELPPVGADLATKGDISLLQADMSVLRSDIERLDRRIEERAELTEERLGRQIAELSSQVADVRSHLSAQLLVGVLPLVVALIVALFLRG